jgi:hypothetical protein
VDHLIPLELGGSNDIANLWPQSYVTVWNAHMKDRLENRLNRGGVRTRREPGTGAARDRD